MSPPSSAISEAFAALADEIVAAAGREMSEKREIRVWIAGCASGEEAYSIAIAFSECAEARGKAAERQDSRHRYSRGDPGRRFGRRSIRRAAAPPSTSDQSSSSAISSTKATACASERAIRRLDRLQPARHPQGSAVRAHRPAHLPQRADLFRRGRAEIRAQPVPLLPGEGRRAPSWAQASRWANSPPNSRPSARSGASSSRPATSDCCPPARSPPAACTPPRARWRVSPIPALRRRRLAVAGHCPARPSPR